MAVAGRGLASLTESCSTPEVPRALIDTFSSATSTGSCPVTRADAMARFTCTGLVAMALAVSAIDVDSELVSGSSVSSVKRVCAV